MNKLIQPLESVKAVEVVNIAFKVTVLAAVKAAEHPITLVFIILNKQSGIDDVYANGNAVELNVRVAA